MNKMEVLKAMLADLKQTPQRLIAWAKTDAKYWGIAFGSMVTFLIALDMLIGNQITKKVIAEVAYFETEVEQAIEDMPITHFEVGETPIEPTVLNTETLTEPPASIEQEAQFNDNSAIFEEAGGGLASATTPSFGGLGGFDVTAIGGGPAVRGPGGVGVGVGTSDKAGSGGAGEGFGGRGSGSRQAMLASGGGTAESERAVAAATNWLARHQNPDGGWGCREFVKQCKDPSCSAHAAKEGADYPMAATAFGLLPFFAAGQTHETKGPYQKVIYNGLLWMTRHQDQKTGRLGTGNMYEHGLATIAICEAYGLSKDQKLRPAAQAAVAFIVDAQNDTSGGWHYTANPPTPGDTSVVGWQLMGLKSAQMAGLPVPQATIEKSKKFLASVAKGNAGGLFMYSPGSGGPTPAMSAVGLLCNQYTGMKRTDPAMIEGMNYVMSHLNTAKTNSYFLYYATQVMHNLPGPEWDKWNREARRHLISTQIKNGCAAGAWAPNGHNAGPVMSTSIHALTLEVYYRYLPLYQIDKKDATMP